MTNQDDYDEDDGFAVTDDGKLEKNDEEDADFEENLTFDA